MKITLSQPVKCGLEGSDLAGVLYLILPLLLFFALYATPTVSLPASALILYAISRLTFFKSAAADWKSIFANLLAAVGIVYLSGVVGPLYNNTDWEKHFAIYNTLSAHDSLIIGGDTLRYYLGMYIIPAGLKRLFPAIDIAYLVGCWLVLGLFIFFMQMSRVFSGFWLKYTAPIIFMLYSGSDAIGFALTRFQRGDIGHLEWWSGWVEYSSFITSMFWSPQNTLPAWIIIGLVFNKHRPAVYASLGPLVICACFFWAPFVLVGLLPILAVYFFRAYRDLVVSAPFVFAFLAMFILLIEYMTAGSGEIPKHFVWNMPCLRNDPLEACFTYSHYFRFILVEFIPAYAAVLLVRENRRIECYVVGLILLGLPLVQIGSFNELAMYACRPALCLLVLMLVGTLRESARPPRILACVVLAAGALTPITEITRSLTMTTWFDKNITLAEFVEKRPQFTTQYYSATPIWFIR